MIKLTKKNQQRHEAWVARVAAEGIQPGLQVQAKRVTLQPGTLYVQDQWWEPAEVVEVRNFDAVVRFQDGTTSSSGLGLEVTK